MSGVRTFIGIPLPEDVVTTLLVACDAVRVADPSWRSDKWVPRQNIHVTVKFLGDIPDDSLDALADTVESAASECEAFELADAGIRAVPNPRRARMLWGTFADPEGMCAALASTMDRVGLEFGVAPDERSFRPHATLVRARHDRRLGAAALVAARLEIERIPERVSVGSVTLYASRLTSSDPVYTALRACELGHA